MDPIWISIPKRSYQLNLLQCQKQYKRMQLLMFIKNPNSKILAQAELQNEETSQQREFTKFFILILCGGQTVTEILRCIYRV